MNTSRVVKGRVIDKQSGGGVAQAQVVIEGTKLDAATDKDGNFTIANVPPGDLRLNVRKLGYGVATIPLANESRDAEGTTVALTPSRVALEALVVTSAENAPRVSAAGAVSKGVAEAPLRVVRVDSTAGVKRTTYEVSKGVEVILIDSPVETMPERDDVARQKIAAAQSTAAQRENVLSGRVAGAAAPAATVAPTTITWTDRGRKFVLTGRLATKDLETIKARLMQMRR
jgi:hypothetical protein